MAKSIEAIYITVAVLLVSILNMAIITEGSPISPFSNVDEIYVLAGQQRSLWIQCTSSNPATIQWLLNNVAIKVDNDKYTETSRGQLQISDLVGSDEGMYSCSFQVENFGLRTVDLACVYVLGKAMFALDESTNTVSAFSGSNVQLDTVIEYVGSGSSERTQDITLLQLFKVDRCSETRKKSLVYFCSNEGSLLQKEFCPPNAKFAPTNEGSHKFDIKMILMNASEDDAGKYLVNVEVLNPGTSSRSYIEKCLTLNVHDPFVMAVNQENISEPVPKLFLQCQVQLDENDRSDQFDLIWRDSQGHNIENDIGVATHITVSNEFLVLTAVINISAVHQNGEYLCTVLLNIPNTNQSLSQTLGFIFNQSGPSGNSTNQVLFQVYIGPVSSLECSAWSNAVQSTEIERTVREGVALAASTQSGRKISATAFEIGRLSCRGPQGWLSFRSSIKDSEAHSKTQVLSYIEEWVQTTGTVIKLGLFQLNVGSGCKVRIASLAEDECYRI